MLVRFVAKNILSFGDETELFMGPRAERNLRDEHIYNVCDFDLMKMSAVYGANASGKSNLVKAARLLKHLVMNTHVPPNWNHMKYRFMDETESSVLAIEFIHKETAFIYQLEIFESNIKSEELYYSGLGQKDNELCFKRFVDKDGKTKLEFLQEFEQKERTSTLKDIYTKNIIQPNETLLKFLSEVDEDYFKKVKIAFDWFKNCLHIVHPSPRFIGLIDKLEKENEFKLFFDELLYKADIGINRVDISKKSIEEIISDTNASIKSIIEGIKNESESDETHDHEKIVNYILPDRTLIQHNKENDEWVYKGLDLFHTGGKTLKEMIFSPDEESDGTQKLMELIPAFYSLLMSKKVFIIDEIERSIHPNLIKALIAKFSHKKDTKGQLIFTTHETNLLDQSIIRRDEVWFTEKNKKGMTELYSLGEFKDVHKTNNIQKGYLSGRYEGVPYIKKLEKLDWKSYAR